LAHFENLKICGKILEIFQMLVNFKNVKGTFSKLTIFNIFWTHFHNFLVYIFKIFKNFLHIFKNNLVTFSKFLKNCQNILTYSEV
jgi:hypothetical protein